MNQDLWLQTQVGSIRLQWVSRWGPLGNLWPLSPHPAAWIDQPVRVTGWFRRGAAPWIDVDTLQVRGQPILQAGHPIWSTLVAVITALLGLWMIANPRFLIDF